MTKTTSRKAGENSLDYERNITELTTILKREIRSFNTIVELLVLEGKALVECDNNLLMQVIEREEDVLTSIACLEKSRMEVVRKIAAHIKENPDTLTVTNIAETVEGPLKNELVETAHVLNEINADIQQRKLSNNLLIKQGIMVIESNIRSILKAAGKENLIKDIYSAGAEYGRISGSIRIDGRL